MKQILTPDVRSWLYGVISAVLAIIAAYGLISADEVPLWLTLAAALLGLTGSTVATAYRPTKHPDDAPDIDPDEEA